MIDENYFKTMKSTFFRQHMVNDIDDDNDDDDDDDDDDDNEAYSGSRT